MKEQETKGRTEPPDYANTSTDLNEHVSALHAKILVERTARHKGRVVSVRGTSIRVTGLPVHIGQRCILDGTRHNTADASTAFSELAGCNLEAEVVGFEGNEAILIPLGELDGLALGSQVTLTRTSASVGISSELFGRVLDGFGRPLDGLPVPEACRSMPLKGNAPSPLKRQRVQRPLCTGVRAIDGLLTVGQGQRFGIFAPAGAGKSTLLGMLADTQDIDVVVIALIGERGREVRDFLEDSLKPLARSSSVCVVATSDRPAIERIGAAHTATALAEGYALEGKNVLLLVDSLTRFARAVREVGLAAGEPPVRQGFTPSVFAELPRLLERSGTAVKGSITAFYTVLTDDELANDPVAEEVRSILDGNIVLSRTLAARNHYPAIDIAQSISRLFLQLAPPRQAELASQVRKLLAKYQEIELLVQVGEYRKGSDAVADHALAVIDRLESWLKQSTNDWADEESMVSTLIAALDQS